MEQEEQKVNHKDNIKGKKKKAIKALLLIIAIPVVLFLLIVGYFYMSLFEINYVPKTMASYWNESQLEQQLISSGNKILIEIPEHVINTELMIKMKEMKLPKHFKVETIVLEGSRLNMNVSVYGIKVPISTEFTPKIESGQIIIPFHNLIIGKNGITLNDDISSKIINKAFEGNFPIKVDVSKELGTDLLKISDIRLVNELYQVDISINNDIIREELNKICQSSNNEIISYFSQSTEELEKKAFFYLTNSENLSDADIDNLINDILSGCSVMKNILLATDQSVYDELNLKYAKYLKVIDKTVLLEKKKELLTGILGGYYDKIFNAFYEDYFIGKSMYINRGQPYDLSAGEYITINKVVGEATIEVPYLTLPKLDFCYDFSTNTLMLSYKVDSIYYLVIDVDNAVLMQAKEYEERFTYENTGVASKVSDIKTWEAIESALKAYFQIETVFIRYAKFDEKYGFVIASPDFNYQNYWIFAFEKKEEEWVLLEGNIGSVDELNKSYPRFNLETATNELVEVELFSLNEDMYQVILDDLTDKGIINGNDDVTIVYCSYGNQYIDFMLSDGRNYVYLVYKMYLHTVYDQDTAISTWTDLPDLITLDEKPKTQ